MQPFRTATTQHGLVTWAQLVAAGAARSTIHGWVDAGRLVQVQPRVYRVEGAPVTWTQRVLAAVLAAGPGAAASHRTAAALWGLMTEGLIAIEVDGYGPHSSAKAFQSDRDRQNALVALGWTILRFTWADVVKRPEHVASSSPTRSGALSSTWRTKRAQSSQESV